ncbi:hypothetical protein ARTHRO9V_120049 [Arthrobacter sp. 9V]|nr:hypothetical protein ARTHRO9V_120049 [Arthrobacter sp. 9V]
MRCGLLRNNRARILDPLHKSEDLLGEVALFLDLCSLTAQCAHVVKLGAADVTLGDDLDLVDDRGVYREGTLYADTEGNLAHGEGFANAVTLAAQDEALEYLDTGVLAFDDVDVNLEGVARTELRNIITQRGCIYAIEDMH